ncbi:DUF4268 domain-containing protein [Polluticoccus soli]|uniref:DUF4268 domain-containing protein n=1 Tax=Polluticoccus soli TaxID=3034150 RepID=UPI0023E0CB29|nr:DUF4268 domain-containing protein [Flavipsychrobacter sp. JY13-12]
MYSRQEIAQKKEAFWTTFGRYMQPITPAGSDKVNWINYKTGVPGISFKMDADSKRASIAIVLNHIDPAVRRQHYEQILTLKHLLRDATGEDWTWEPEVHDDYGKVYSRIGTVSIGHNILEPADWPALISFLKPRIIALDEFWSNTRFAFEL